MVMSVDFLTKYKVYINDSKLLSVALTHSSYANEFSGEDYERLEFLGDAVLQIIVSEYLYKTTNLNEGDMTKLRASFVCEHALAAYSNDIGLIPFIKTGAGQNKNVNETIIADIFESVLGAIYLSNGLSDCEKIITAVVIPYIESGHSFMTDYKTILQEYVQTDKKSLEYKIIKESGPAHDKIYTIEVRIDGMIFGRGTGRSKKEAEQQAAFDAYKKCAKN